MMPMTMMFRTAFSTFSLLVAALFVADNTEVVHAFAVLPQTAFVKQQHAETFRPSSADNLLQPPKQQQQELQQQEQHGSARSSRMALFAGGFEWEDPGKAADQGVENPFKNPALMAGSDGSMKIDPARLLGPRLSGTNLYFIGMMGCGKTAVGDLVARRECTPICKSIILWILWYLDVVVVGKSELLFVLCQVTHALSLVVVLVVLATAATSVTFVHGNATTQAWDRTTFWTRIRLLNKRRT